MLNSRRNPMSLAGAATVAAILLLAALMALAGRAEAAASLSLNMSSFDYGAKHVGGEGTQPGDFVVINDGDEPVKIGWADTTPASPRVFFVNGAFDLCTFATLDPGESCQLSTYFDPPVAGEFTGKLIVPSEDLDEPVTADLEGIGFPQLMPDVKITPSSHDFGRVGIGTTSTVKTIEVRNTGEGDMRLGDSTLEGAERSAFGIVEDNCNGIQIAAGSVCTVKVAFKPDSAGTRQAILMVPTDVEGADTRVPLTGTGVGIVPDPDPDPDEPGIAKLRIPAKPAAVKRGALRLPVVCSTMRMERCAGSLAIRSARAGKPGRRLVKAKFDLPPGRAKLSLRLRRADVRTIARKGGLKVVVTARVAQGDGGAAVSTVKRRIKG